MWPRRLPTSPSTSRRAREFYQKSLEIDRKIAELNTRLDALSAQGTDREVKAHWKLSKEIAELEYRSHELRKDASRQLREGSRTAGSLILCENIAEIQQLFQKALECSLKAPGGPGTVRPFGRPLRRGSGGGSGRRPG